MGIGDLIKKLTVGGREHEIEWRVDPYEGVDFILKGAALSDPEQSAIDSPFFGLQYAYLKGLHEQGYASRNANGFTVLSEQLIELDDDFFEVFSFPKAFSGTYQARFEGNTGQAAFSAAIDLVMPDSTRISRYSLYGPFLRLAESEIYRLSPAEWQALTAVQTHTDLDVADRGEYENNWLVFQLQIAKKSGMRINLAHFEHLELLHPEAVGVAVEQMPNGDLSLNPTYGSGIDIADIKARLGQIKEGDSHCILRVKNRFVLLDKARLEATEEILSNTRIPKDQVAQFLKSPTAYLDAALIDLDTGFSLRVHGAERYTHRYFGEVEESKIDWFAISEALLEPADSLKSVIDSEEILEEVEIRIRDALAHGSDTLEVEDRIFDISDPEEVSAALALCREKLQSPIAEEDPISTAIDEEEGEFRSIGQAVLAIDSNDEEADFSKSSRLDDFNPARQTFATDNLKRKPFPHQNDGIRWLLAHLESAKSSDVDGGALLADDMGLGKTYMTLVGVEEWYRRCKVQGDSEKPTLIVAPLTLLENWQAEVSDTFHRSPFSDIVVLQAGADLPTFKVVGSGRETQQEFTEGNLISEQDQIRYSLKVGKSFGHMRLDMPRRLVLTTYQTLRDYQFSLSRVDWGVVAFDEAQNLKNPNALATRAAKGLKSDFKLLATGTPVENSLKDFWCLMDTATPGLLGAWQSFRKEYISPITSAEPEIVRQIKIEVGGKLRSTVGNFMLRRTKAEHLDGLPEKRIFTGDESSPDGMYKPELAGVMKGPQLDHYDEIIASVRSRAVEDRRSLVLPGLLRLKITSIHQDIESKQAVPRNAKDLLRQAETSIKMRSMLSILNKIEKRGEKVIIFATTKAVQAYASALITSVFGVPVEIINGDTKAVPSKRDTQTRKVIIDRYQALPGFGVIVMSPVAAGVGLTVVAANNVIHLERHWNPAKEAQATDRVYRIGQKRDVNVYVPMALHPTAKSFDQKLNGLLVNKVDLSDAVVAPSIVDSADLESCF
jgi:SNF2 family DNA or RNA helicase